MKHSVLPLLGLALLALALVLPARAQPSGDAQRATPYFHEAAQQYVNANLQQALATVNEGLRVAPDDARLQTLREKIRQQRQQSDSESSGPSSAPQEGNTPQNSSASDNEDARGSEPSPESEESEAPSSDEATEDGASGGDASVSPDQSPADNNMEDNPEDMEHGDELSRAQAARMLRALENQEKQLLRQVQRREPLSQRILKEW